MKKPACLLLVMLLVFFISCTGQQKPAGTPTNQLPRTPVLSEDSSAAFENDTDYNNTESQYITFKPFLMNVEGGGSRGNQYCGSIISRDNALFLLGDNEQSIYRVNQGKSNRLYSASEDFVILKKLSEQDGYLFFLKDNGLYKLSLNDDVLELLWENTWDYDIYGKIAYVSNMNGALYAFEINNPNNSVLLQNNAFSFSAVSTGVIYELHEGQNPFDSSQYRIYLHKRNGESILLSEGATTRFQTVGDNLYYKTTPSNSEGKINNLIWSINYKTGEKSIIYDQEKVSPSMNGLNAYVVHDNIIYLWEDNDEKNVFSSYAMESGTYKTFMEYACEPTDLANGVLDPIHIFNFETADDYIYLNGKCYVNGNYLTTRFPVAGNIKGKQEEVFYDGKWISASEYLDLYAELQ